jgi:hypothetical protein
MVYESCETPSLYLTCCSLGLKSLYFILLILWLFVKLLLSAKQKAPELAEEFPCGERPLIAKVANRPLSNDVAYQTGLLVCLPPLASP